MSGDNVTAPGAGATFRTDFDSANSVHYPVEKVAFGADQASYTFVADSDGSRFPVKPAPDAMLFAHSSVAMQTGASVVALQGNPLAKYRLFQNISPSGTVALSSSSAAVMNSGIVLYPQDTYEMSLMLGNLDRSVFNAIGTTTSTLLVTEGA